MWSFLSRRPARSSSRRALPRLEALEDRLVPAPVMVTSAADNGPGTLRAAIAAANRTNGLVTIDFAIGARGSAQAINLTSPLPTITATVVIDGTSQGGSGYAGAPLIFLNGTWAGAGASGLNLACRNSTVEGLAIEHFAQDGILLRNAAAGNTIGGTTAGAGNVISGNGNDGIEIVNAGTAHNLIEGNFIGTNFGGTAAIANKADGVLIHTRASANTVGGTSSGAGNVISGNGNDGVEIVDVGTKNNVVQGNLIGTTRDGSAAIANKFDGVLIRTGATTNAVGGAASGARNVISGNVSNGVEIVGPGTTGNVVQGNLIGVRGDGASGLGNGTNGVAVRNLAAHNTVGGTVNGAGNTIAFNGGDGVLVGDTTAGIVAGTGNAIEGNSIYGNKRLGIFLGYDNTSKPPVVLLNNSKGHPNADNRFQNYPVLNVPQVTSNSTALSGTISSPNNPGTTIRIEFFASTGADPTGYGQGETFLGAVTVTTNAAGQATFSLTLTTRLPAGTVISATATDATGNTSEFARNVLAP